VVTLDEGGELELPLAALARHKPGCPHDAEQGKGPGQGEDDPEGGGKEGN